MASGTVQSGLIERIQLNDDTYQRIASTAYGVCSTLANNENKTVQIDGFELVTGVTIHVKFTYDNTASSPPTLNVNGTGAINIVQYSNIAVGITSETDGWQAGAVISFTYDGTYWVRDQGYNTNTTYSSVSTSTAGLVPQAPNDATKFLRGDATWSILPAASDSIAGIITVGVSGGAATYNHTHTISLTEAGTSTVDLTENTTYTLTAGGQSVVFKTPASSGHYNTHLYVTSSSGTSVTDTALDNGEVYIKLYDSTTVREAYKFEGAKGIEVITDTSGNLKVQHTHTDITAKTSYAATATTASANGGTIILTDIKYDTQGHITDSTDRTITLSVPVTSVATLTGAITAPDLIAQLGLSSALRFRGVVASTSTYQPSDGTNGTPTLAGVDSYTPANGDVILDKDEHFEYVYANNVWERLGGDDSYKVVQTAVSTATSENTAETRFVSSVTQNTQGVITVTTRPLDTSGTWSGNASTATALANARTIQVDLTSSSAASFDGTANITPGVTGVLPIANGGTNTSTAPTVGGIIYGGGSSGSEAYASTGAGTAGQVLISNGANAPSWYAGLSLTSTTANSTTTYDASFEGSVSINTNTTIGGTLSVTGATTLSSDLTITGNIVPSTTNTYSLGSSTSSKRWSGVYIGTADSYGDAYTPVYWNGGVPAATSPVQYFTWTINSGKTGVTLTGTGIFTADTYNVTLVVTSGEENLNGPLTWTSASNTFTIQSSAVTSGAVSGYAVVARGSDITSSLTAVQLPSS